MGNCSRKKKQNRAEKQEDAEDGDVQPNEDVTYASIDHSIAKANNCRVNRETECDYATVHIPRAQLQKAESDSSSTEDCAAEDYVTMN